jgi:hypothetical protein
MFAAIKGFAKALFGFAGTSGGQGVIAQALDIAKEKIVDTDQLVHLIKDVVIAQLNAESNPTWVNALQNISTAPPEIQKAVAGYIRGDTQHKKLRAYLWGLVIIAYVGVAVLTGQPMDINTLALLAAGPGLYTIMKGAGRK